MPEADGQATPHPAWEDGPPIFGIDEAPEAGRNLHLPRGSVAELKIKSAILDRIMREARDGGDKRWEGLIPQHEEIQRRLVAAIREERRRRGEPEPEPIVVGMRGAPLHATRLKMMRKGQPVTVILPEQRAFLNLQSKPEEAKGE